MAARPLTPSHDGYGSMPNPTESSHLNRGYGYQSGSRPTSYIASGSVGPSDLNVGHGGVPDQSPLSHSARFHEEFSASRRGSSLLDNGIGDLQRSDSQMSQSHTLTPSRGGTLKKKPSLGKKGSLRKSNSRKSSRAGSVRSLFLGEKEKYSSTGGDDVNNAFYVPIPTTGSPTDILVNRFQAWRKVLKDLLSFFRDIQKSYDTRAKLLFSASNVMNNVNMPPTFLASGGIADAAEFLKDYHRQALVEVNKAKEVENEVILRLAGLRTDLQNKTKEIKGLSGDFKNSVDKEVEATRKAVRQLQESLGLVDTDPAVTSGKGDPFIVRMNVDRQVEKQIEEENYLHRAFLNLEKSGRELEAIVVGEIQAAYNAYASILKREADVAYDAVEKLRDGPISMPKDHEWNFFISSNDNLVDSRVPLRNFENISYPGKDHPAAAEVRAGMLERKSKYLKSYTPGWYVLSPTHLHEFKSADRISSQSPVMSLYLPEQKLGSHSQDDSSSHKFMLKGRQTGAMHRGHSWVFRAESHETMLAWYEDIKNLTEKTGEARNAFVRRHARSLSGSHKPGSISSDGAMEEDEADETPYAADGVVSSSHGPPSAGETQWQRPQPGGRFPSDVQLNRHLHVPMSPSSGESSGDREALAAAGALPGSGVPFTQPEQAVPDGRHNGWAPNGQPRSEASNSSPTYAPERQDHQHVEWTAPVVARSRNSYDPHLHQQLQQTSPLQQSHPAYDTSYETANKYDIQHSPAPSRSGSAPIPLVPDAAPTATPSARPVAAASTNSTRPESNSSTNHSNQSVADSSTGLGNTITTDTSINEGNGVDIPNAPNGSAYSQPNAENSKGSRRSSTATSAKLSPLETTSTPNPEPATSASTIGDLKLPGEFPS
ncbi:hypothetical protein FQN54_000529 [Arachnomyces sp. PD_36]|nr:hypothetical protein FQN54_000529 [Arachnomyces sp. PD_36]